MKTYELTYIITPQITSEEAEAKSKEIESAIQHKEGVITKQLNPTAKALAHPVAKHASGFLGVMEFQMESEKLPELEQMLSKDVQINMHMVVIKRPARLRKEKRTREKIPPEIKIEGKEPQPTVQKAEEKPKMELKDLEQKLDEILGE